MTATSVIEAIRTPRFAGHETFTLRYGWLKKAVDATSDDPLIFTRDDALVSLGVGKNMVRSIRHWGLATGVLEEDIEQPNNRGRAIRPSQLGMLLFGPDGLDPYLEDPATFWLLHWQLASRPDGPTTWYWAFNHFAETEFTKERLGAGLRDLVDQAGWKRVAASSLKRDVDCFIRTYVHSRSSRTAVLEDTLDCPLAELGLVQELESGRLYTFVRDEHPSLTAPAVLYATLQYWESAAPQRQTLTFDEVAYRPGSPGRVFKLSENALTEYLEAIEDHTDRGIGYDVTAGLRQLYRRKSVDPTEVLCLQHATASRGAR
jgi:hypothetical protein